MFPVAGILMDKFGRKSTAIPSLILLGISLSLIPISTTYLLLTMVGIIAGIGNGISSGLILTLGSDLSPKNRPGEFLGIWRFISDSGGLIAPLFYKGYPKSVCTSINHVICHGIPSSRILENGDIVNIDVTVIVDGWHGDTSRMFPVGKINAKAQKLIDCTFHAMHEGINAAQPDATLGDIGSAIQTYAEKQNYSVVFFF